MNCVFAFIFSEANPYSMYMYFFNKCLLLTICFIGVITFYYNYDCLLVCVKVIAESDESLQGNPPLDDDAIEMVRTSV